MTERRKLERLAQGAPLAARQSTWHLPVLSSPAPRLRPFLALSSQVERSQTSQDEYFEDWYDAARSGGRTHQATDIMAPRGTPIVSPETGVLSQVGSNPLGGNRVWVSGGSGYHYYLAHMNAFAPGIADGVKVQAGQLLGFVGNTGTGASKTDPHLHIAIHWPEKSSKPPLNPYVVLKATPEGAAAVERGATANTSSNRERVAGLCV